MSRSEARKKGENFWFENGHLPNQFLTTGIAESSKYFKPFIEGYYAAKDRYGK